MRIASPSPSVSAVRLTDRGTSPGSAASARPLAHQPERDRLEQRAARVRQVLHALRERAAARDTAGGAPRPLRAAIEDFGRELADLERRLSHPRRHPSDRSGRSGR
jgi:hypothetical protein